MELQIVINNLGMKIKVLILMIFAFHFLSFSQEENNSKHYKLYKNGEKVPRPIVYILNNSTTNLQKLDNGDIIFNIDNQSFKYQSNTHKKDSLTISDFKKIEFKKIKELSYLEYEEYVTTATKIMTEKGFKPAPPINHSILKIFVISKNKNNIIRYETNWMYSKF